MTGSEFFSKTGSDTFRSLSRISKKIFHNRVKTFIFLRSLTLELMMNASNFKTCFKGVHWVYFYHYSGCCSLSISFICSLITTKLCMVVLGLEKILKRLTRSLLFHVHDAIKSFWILVPSDFNVKSLLMD